MIGPVGEKAKPWHRKAGLKSLFDSWAAMETGRFVLWAPVFMILGVALYFQLSVEPSLLSIVSGLGVCALFWASMARLRPGIGNLAAKGVFFVTLGLASATFRTMMVDTPVLPRPLDAVPIEGTLVAREDRATDQRFTIEPEMIGALMGGQRPHLVRVTWRGKPSDVAPGDRVRLFGKLMPPPGPAIPGGFDYGRQLYYDGIGAVGYLYAGPRIISRSVRPTFSTRIERLRDRIAERIERLTPGISAPVMAALVTGQRDGIPEDVTGHLRDTGLAHLLAISGLHMGLVCGVLFFSLRFLFACHPGWAGRYPIKKWAAVGGIAGGVFYLALSGAPVSAQRAFIMAMIGFVAILFDRRAISLRNVALAALVIILLTPEAVMSAGFQMSFAAVMALVATYDLLRRRQGYRQFGLLGRVGIFFGALFLTSFIAGLATSPMSIFHFNRIATYGLGANMLVMPLFTLIVMPGAVLGLTLMPLGLDQLVWPVIGHTLNLLLRLTEVIASQPGAVTAIPQWSGHAWGLVMGGMTLLCLLKAPWRWGAILVILMGLAVAPFSPRPVLVVAEDMANIAALDDQGELDLMSRRGARFSVERWHQLYGLSIDKNNIFQCSENICTIPVPEEIVLIARTGEGVREACREASIVLTRIWEADIDLESCPATLITSGSVARTGPLAIFQTSDGLIIHEARALRGDRPWVPPPY